MEELKREVEELKKQISMLKLTVAVLLKETGTIDKIMKQVSSDTQEDKSTSKQTEDKFTNILEEYDSSNELKN